MDPIFECFRVENGVSSREDGRNVNSLLTTDRWHRLSARSNWPGESHGRRVASLDAEHWLFSLTLTWEGSI